MVFLVLLAAWAHGQPSLPAGGDAPCEEAPTPSPSDRPDGPVDAEGYLPLFNGKDFTGWWQNCRTYHTSGSTRGAIFRVDTAAKAIYTAYRRNADPDVRGGGVLMTRWKFLHYELVFDYWPDWGNDAGIFNRSTVEGNAYKTTLEYIKGASLGGVWGEAGFTLRDIRPFTFGESEQNILIRTDDSTRRNVQWDYVTRKNHPSRFGCDSLGCREKDWQRLWDFNGWNQIRIKFYGGTVERSGIGSKTWFRKMGSETWVPLTEDTTLIRITPAGHIGLLVFGAESRFSGAKGTWYRNIRWKELTSEGAPLYVADRVNRGGNPPPGGFEIRRDFAGRAMVIHPRESRPGFVEILTLAGKRVETLPVVQGKAVWNAAGRSPGVYLVRAEGQGRAWPFVLE